MEDKGVLKESEMFFHTPTQFCKQTLYYLVYSGYFVTTEEYLIKRDNWSSYLILLVKEGTIEVTFEGKTFIANKGSVILLNCFKPHSYQALVPSKFTWFHFRGNTSKSYCQHIYNKYGCIMENVEHTTIENLIETIWKLSFNYPDNEELISIYIHQTLYELNQNKMRNPLFDEILVEEAIQFINNHYYQQINLNDISQYVNLSRYYFSRLFKQAMGESPINYLIKVRLEKAKYFLFDTNSTISEIASECGFNSESHFITTFKKYNEITPNEFRNIKF